MTKHQSTDPHGVRDDEPTWRPQSLERLQLRAANDNAPGRRTVMIMNLHMITPQPGEIAVIDRLLQEMSSAPANDNTLLIDALRP